MFLVAIHMKNDAEDPFLVPFVSKPEMKTFAGRNGSVTAFTVTNTIAIVI